jgi:hypothetical protein
MTSPSARTEASHANDVWVVDLDINKVPLRSLSMMIAILVRPCRFAGDVVPYQSIGICGQQ